MKTFGFQKVIGLSIGGRSLLAAEIDVGGKRGSEAPAVRWLGELPYPDGATLVQPAALGIALAAFLKSHGASARTAVVGLPARWLVVKQKDVPAVDDATLADVLRLQAEGDFSSELKDLVYDYTASAPDRAAGDAGRTALLVATPKKYVDAAAQLCEAAKLTLAAVMPAAVALGAATTRASADEALVLSIAPGGTELTAHANGAASAVRHLRGTTSSDDRAFLGELRRAVSAVPLRSLDGGREMVLWDGAGVDSAALSQSLGVPVQAGDLSRLGVEPGDDASRNGQGRRYAAAVALALAGTADVAPAVNFLRPKLAAPVQRRVPRWALAAALSVAIVALGGWYAYSSLRESQAKLDDLNRQIDTQKPEVEQALAFVNTVTLAEAWHGSNPRYLACLRDLTNAMPEDGQTYATNLTLDEATPVAQATPPSGGAAKGPALPPGTLAGKLQGKAPDQSQPQYLFDRLSRTKGFTNVASGGSQDAGKSHEVSFLITFNYTAPVPTVASSRSSTSMNSAR